MLQKYTILYIAFILIFIFQSCGTNQDKMNFTGEENEVILMTLDPGHFHAALVQKKMYEQISPKVYVYAPEGPDVQDHLDRIENFNNRDENPTNWETVVYTGPDYLEKMIDEKPGKAIAALQDDYPGVELQKQGSDWHVVIPDRYRVGHEAHFGAVTEKYLKFLVDGKLPDWEVPNMIAKYYTITSALEMAMLSE